MEEPLARRRRLLGPTGLLGMNTQKLARVLAQLQGMSSDDLDFLRTSGVSRTSLRKTVDDVFRHVGEHLDLPSVRGGPVRVFFVSIPKLWSRILNGSDVGYAKQLLALPRSSLGNPWHLILYGDEVTPGNILAPDNQRKTFSVAFTLREFAADVRSHTAAWFPLCLIRTHEYQRIHGGISTVMRFLLRHIFLTQRLSHGVAIGRLGVVHLGVSNVIMDGDAIRLTLNTFAAKALLPCTCLNVFQGPKRDPRNLEATLRRPSPTAPSAIVGPLQWAQRQRWTRRGQGWRNE